MPFILAEAGASGGFDLTVITSALESLITITGKLIDYTLSQPVLALCFVAGTVVPAGFAMFARAKYTAR